MKTTTELLLLAAASAIVFTASCSDSPARPDASVAPATGSTEVSDPPEDDDPPQVWPQVIEEGRIKVTFYEPQVESWDGAQLVARLAVSVETAASPEPHYGTIWVSAHTHVFKEEHLAVLQSPTVMRAAFPSAPGLTDEWLALIRKHLPDVRVWELDRLEASAAASTSKATPRAVVLNNDPPPIFFSRSPALLVLIDGPPAQRRVPGTQIQRVINTRALLLVEGEAAPTFYLGIGSRWLKAEALEGPWTLVRRTPYGLEVAKKLAVDAKLVDLHENDPEMSRIFESGEVPQIIVSTRPAELIVTKGEPQFAPVPGTRLLWARNTDANIFHDAQTGLVYVLIGGRWFRARSADGPWAFVGPGQLPADFARIPEADPAGEVLASVPGTPQAEEAVIANGIPQTAQIDRARARLETTYDGDPQFEPIGGTDLTYALNTATPVIRVGDRYFACEDGAWFSSSSPAGPWVLADSVPDQIYEIPPSCPIHYVTYCRVYEAERDWVCFGYTPGYFGCYVSDGCVVWGTGLWWRPWVGTRWLGCPWTYGFGIGVRWGLGFGASVEFGIGARPFCAPWWGPLGRPHPAFYPLIAGNAVYNLNVRNANIYAAWPGTAVRSTAPYVPRVAPTRQLPNNVYSDTEGRVYRQTERGWEMRDRGAWRSAPTPSHLDSQQWARERGATRSTQRREPMAPPHVYRPMPSQHEPTIPGQRPAPRPIPPGLRGGRGGGGGGGGHHGR